MAGRGSIPLGAVGGCVAAGVPLLAADVFANVAGLSASDSTVLGMGGLLGGIALGGAVAGLLAGRRGGVSAAIWAGVLAAVLYAAVVVGSMLGWSAVESARAPLLSQPVSLGAGLIFLGALLVVVALVVGFVVSPRVTSPSTRVPSRGGQAATRPVPPARVRGGPYLGMGTRPKSAANTSRRGGERLDASAEARRRSQPTRNR